MRRQRRFVEALSHKKAPEFSGALFRGTNFVLGWLAKPEEVTLLLPLKRDISAAQ
jgi:hypothetical protein